MKNLGRKKYPRIEATYVAAFLLSIFVSSLFTDDGYTLRTIVETIHGLIPLTGFSFIVFVYLFSPQRFWVFFLLFTLLLTGMIAGLAYFIFNPLHSFSFWELLSAAWLDSRGFVFIAAPVAIIVTLLKLVGIFKWSIIDEK